MWFLFQNALHHDVSIPPICSVDCITLRSRTATAGGTTVKFRLSRTQHSTFVVHLSRQAQVVVVRTQATPPSTDSVFVLLEIHCQTLLSSLTRL